MTMQKVSLTLPEEMVAAIDTRGQNRSAAATQLIANCLGLLNYVKVELDHHFTPVEKTMIEQATKKLDYGDLYSISKLDADIEDYMARIVLPGGLDVARFMIKLENLRMIERLAIVDAIRCKQDHHALFEISKADRLAGQA